MPANFRTYEGQLRLLTAVIAAHPSLKLDYKGKSSCCFRPHFPTNNVSHFPKSPCLMPPDVAAHYGSDWTVSGIEHFFRPIKKNAKSIQALVKRGEDAAAFVHNTVS